MEIFDLAAQLAKALPGVRLQNLGDQSPDWTPIPGRCHANARRWVDVYPDFQIVHGWLYAERETFPNRERFHAHSVVRRPDGELIDITLRACDPTYQFLPHPGGEEAFVRDILDRVPTVDHLLGPDPVILMTGEDPSLDNRLL